MEKLRDSYLRAPLFSGRRMLQATLIIFLLTTLITSHQAGIIDSILQHKYRTSTMLAGPKNSPPVIPLDPYNASSSSILEHFEGHNGQPTSIEYFSPVEKIMEIISGKPRIIMVDHQHKSLEPETAQTRIPIDVASINTTGLNLDENWAIIGPAERYIPQGYGSSSIIPQESHTAEHIQNMGPHPYSSQHLNELERQILERAASVQNRVPEPQPILLGSYVPPHMSRIHTASNIPSTLSHRVPTPPTVLLRPVTTTETSESEADSEQDTSKENGGDSSENEVGSSDDKPEESKREPSKEESGNGSEGGEKDDEASPEESKRGESQADHEDGNSDEDEPSSDHSNQGSSNYHENYDSDTMNEPTRITSSNHDSEAEPIGESSSTVINGLINVGLNDDCLQCICRASSGCDYLLRCITRGADEKYCGPFQITEDYWKRAGSPGDSPNNFSAFDECANDADCAVETVTNYMKRFHKDCDGDGNITCLDYARLHKLKPHECDKTGKLANNNHDSYWAKFQRCAEGYNRSRSVQDEEDM